MSAVSMGCADTTMAGSGAISKAILIVEDSTDDTILLRRLIERAGIANPVHSVATAEDATAYLEGTYPFSDRRQYPLPGVIMLDLKLPGVDGLRFLEWCKLHAHCKETL